MEGVPAVSQSSDCSRHEWGHSKGLLKLRFTMGKEPITYGGGLSNSPPINAKLVTNLVSFLPRSPISDTNTADGVPFWIAFGGFLDTSTFRFPKIA